MRRLLLTFCVAVTGCIAALGQAPVEVPKPWKTLLQEDLVERVAFSPDGLFLAVDVVDRGRGTPWHVTVYDTRNWKLRRVLRKQCLPAFSADGRYLVTCSVNGEDYDRPAFVAVWRGPSWRRVGRLPYRIDAFMGNLALAARDPVLITARPAGSSSDARQVVETWDLASCRRLSRRVVGCYGLFAWPSPGLVGYLGPAPPGSDLAATQVRDYRSWRVVRTLPTYEFSAMAVSRSGDVVAMTDLDKIHLWSVARRRDLHVLTERARADDVAFSPDGRWLASVGPEWATRLWDVATGRKAYLLSGGEEPVLGVAFSPDGKLLAVAGGKMCAVWLWRVPKR